MKKQPPQAHDEALVARLEARLGISLPDRASALQALTHRSWVNEHPTSGLADNERLEFLGDAVVDLAVSDRLMRRFPNATEGELTRLRASLVDEPGLAAVARSVGLGEFLLLGRGEEQTGGRDRPSVLANALEAVLGALYLAGGLAEVFALVDRLFAQALESADHSRDFKSQLQEIAQTRFKAAPRYRVVSESGPDHEKVFVVEIEAGGERLGQGTGRSKKGAEQAAAGEAVSRLLPPALADRQQTGE